MQILQMKKNNPIGIGKKIAVFWEEGYDFWRCLCSSEGGYDGCDEDGEPVQLFDPRGEYIPYRYFRCERCGRIINRKTLEIIGIRLELAEGERLVLHAPPDRSSKG